MNGKTHVVLGLWSGMGAALFVASPPSQALLFMTVAALSATLPDIDHPRAHLRQRLGCLGHIAFGWLRHRGPTHSITALTLVAIISLHFFPALALPVMLGYASHLVADLMTPRGLAVLWPVVGRVVWLLPRAFRITSGGGRERLLRVALLLALFWQMHLTGVWAVLYDVALKSLEMMKPLICRGFLVSTCADLLRGL